MAKNNKKNKTEEKKNPNSIIAFRKKQKKKSMLLKLLAVALVAAAGIIVAVNAEEIFEPLRGIASKINTKTSDAVGFPVKLPGSATYSFDKFGENFLLLTDTYLYTYETTGAQIYALKHGFTNPVQTANDRRILIYDKGSYDFGLYNKTSLIYEKTLEDKIVYSSLSDSDKAAIVTSSPRYSNILYIFKGNGDQIYSRKFVDENIMQVAFTNDENYVIVTTVTVRDGDIITNVYKYSLKSDGTEEWKYTFITSTIPCRAIVSNENVVIVGDNTSVSLNLNSGMPSGGYSYEGALVSQYLSDDLTALIINDISSNKIKLVSIDGNADFINSVIVSSNVSKVMIDNSLIYLMVGNECLVYNNKLEQQRKISLNEEYSSFIKINDIIYLLGYDVVDRKSIE